MRQQLYRQEIQLAELRGSLTDDHPRVKALVQAIVKSKAILRTAETGRTESVMGANPARAEIHVALLRKQSQLLAAEAKAKTLKTQLQQEEKNLRSFSKNESKFLELTRELQLQEETYRKYVRGVSQATVDQSLEKNKLSNISVSQAASFNGKPSRPNKLINLMLGFALATLASFGTAICLAYMESSTVPATSSTETSETAAVDVPSVAASTRVSSPHFTARQSST